MLTVMKFGGSSVADLAHIRNVAQRCIEKQQAGSQVVVVLSAMGKTTDGLIATAKQITEKPSRREMDMLLATGEQVSVSLMAITMIQMGVSAVSLNAWQVPMHTTSDYQNARFKRIDTERIRKELDDNKIVIVTGFQGINKYDDITTLGRGGSDTTAVALAAELHADVCEIYTDVDGVYTADPRIVPNARKMEEVTYDEMLEMASLGAKVLHSRCVEIAKKIRRGTSGLLQSEPEFRNDGKGENQNGKNVNQRRGCRQKCGKNPCCRPWQRSGEYVPPLKFTGSEQSEHRCHDPVTRKGRHKVRFLYRCKAGYAAHDRCAERQ